MHILMIPINLATAIAINTAGSYQILTPNNQQVFLCVKAIVQRHFSSTHSIIVSFTRNELDDSENTRSVSPYWEQAMTTDALLDSIHSESRWSLPISRPTSNLQIILLWNNQKMQLQATLGVSSWDDTMVCTSGCRYSYKLYSWWWVCKTPETCRVNLAVE